MVREMFKRIFPLGIFKISRTISSNANQKLSLINIVNSTKQERFNTTNANPIDSFFNGHLDPSFIARLYDHDPCHLTPEEIKRVQEQGQSLLDKYSDSKLMELTSEGLDTLIHECEFLFSNGSNAD